MTRFLTFSRSNCFLPAAVVSMNMWVPPTAGQAGRSRSVSDVAMLRQAVATAAPGDRILVAPGEYPGGLYFRGVAGTVDRPILIAAADPASPPRFAGGLHFAGPRHLELRHLVIQGSSGNGLNLDDDGNRERPATGIVLRELTVRDTGPEGNRDGIKLSGLEIFRVERCTVERWGSGGSGIDMVGCRRGAVEECTFRGGGKNAGNGVQMKGGSEAIVVRRNRFLQCGSRAVNAGGSTGLAFFRPSPQGFEAKSITVEHNLFVGGDCAVAFVGVDGAMVHRNTIWMPDRWAFRILQETRAEGFVPSRGGVVEENIVVFRSDRWSEGGVNVGSGTAPESFRFARNVWYCLDRPDRSTPRLPTPEVDGLVGRDPQLLSPDQGDFSLRSGSPAQGRGADLTRRPNH